MIFSQLFLQLEPWHIVLIVIGALLLSSIPFGIWLVFAISRRVFLHTLSNRYEGGWGRQCSAPDNPEQMKMWNDGIEYMSQFIDKKIDVSIINDGLKLAGEFYNFGNKKTAVFLCGRSECLMYGYFYAKPYIESNYNVLFIDPRAHGLSEGTIATAGIKESRDLIAWMKYIKEKYGQEKFVTHCLCVGGSCGLLAATDIEGKELVEKVVLDGAFINFKDSYTRHYVDLGHKKFPVLYLIWFWFRVYTKESASKSDMLACLKKIDVPVLFLHSKNDKYSVPENAELMFKETKTPNKQIVWFDKGSHSHIRNHETEKYDNSIKKFLI